MRDELGSTPLSVTVFWGLLGWKNASAGISNGHKETAELLIAKGADVNARNDRGWTPLDFALNMNNSGAIADFLRKHGGKTSKELREARWDEENKAPGN